MILEGATPLKNRKSALLLILVVIVPLFASVRNVESKARATDICVVGNYAYILLYDDVGLYIVDLSDKSKPKFVSHLKLDAYSCIDIVVDDNYAYISVQSEISPAKFEIYIVDISTPEEPVQVGSYVYSTQYFSSDMFISDNILYLVVYYVLKIINVANPGSPVLLKEESTWTIYGVYIVGNTAFVTVGDTGIKAMDVSTPSSPVLISELTNVEGYGICVDGSYAFLHSTSNIFRVNVANPAAMSKSGTYTNSYFSQFTVSNGILYIIQSSLLHTIDFTTTLPYPLDIYNIGGSYYTMHASDNYVYLSLYDLIILDVTNPNSPNLVSQTKITLPGVLVRNIILGVVALLILLSSIGVIIWRKDQIKERMERIRAQRVITTQGKIQTGKMHRAVKISLIVSVSFFVASIATIIGVQSWDFWTGFPICLSLGPISIGVLCLAPLITWIIVQAKKKPTMPSTDISAKRLSEVAEERQEGMIFCPSCGKEISAEYKHCPKCGHKIE